MSQSDDYPTEIGLCFNMAVAQMGMLAHSIKLREIHAKSASRILHATLTQYYDVTGFNPILQYFATFRLA